MILVPRYRRRQRGWIMTPYRFGASANVTSAPGAGALVLAGQTPSVVRGTSALLLPGAGALALLGQAPGVVNGTSAVPQPGAGALVLAGQTPVIVQGDPNYSVRVAGLHFEGTNGSTTFVDNCPSPQTYTAHTGDSISTTEFKFGASSLRNGGGWIDAPSASVFAPGTGDFGIGGWFRRDVGGSGNLFTFANQNWNVYYDNTASKLKFWDGTADRIDGGAALAQNTWVHVWLERTGTAVKLFSDGTQVGATYTDSGPTNLTAAALMIGAYRSPSTAFFFGYIDDFLFYKGVSVWSSNFTPPTATFPDA